MMPSFHPLATNECDMHLFNGMKAQMPQHVAPSNRVNIADSGSGEIQVPGTNELCGAGQEAVEGSLKNNGDDTDTMTAMHQISHHLSHNRLSVLTLTILVFYNVSGGPFGVEATVRAGGNRMALLGFLLGPIIWSLQEVGFARHSL